MEFPKPKPPWVIKTKRWLMLWAGIAGGRCVAPFRDQVALLQLFAFPIFLYLVFLSQGFRAMSGELLNSWAAAQALIYAVPMFILWNVISAAFAVKQEEKKQGQWFGNDFIYSEPVRVARFVVNSDNNGEKHIFKIPQAEVGGSVQIQTEIGGLEKLRLKTMVMSDDTSFMEPPWSEMKSQKYYTVSHVPRDKKFCLFVNCETINKSIVDVFIVSWGVR